MLACGGFWAPVGEVRRAGWILVAWLSLAGSAWTSQRPPRPPELPKLPQLAVERLPPPARAIVQKALDLVVAHPRDAAANGKLGMLLQAHGLTREAEVCFRRARLLDPSSLRWAYYFARGLAAEGRYQEAVAAFHEAARIAPDYQPAQLALGELLLATARWAEAAKLYKAMVRKHPASAAAYYGLGRVRAVQRDLPGAAESLAKACELFPDFSAAHYALAQVSKRLGKTDESLRHLALFDANKSSRPPAEDPLLEEVAALRADPLEHLRRGLKFAQEGKLREAVAAHLRALDIAPDLVEAHIHLISLYGRLGRFPEAEKHFKLAVRLDGGNPKSHLEYAQLLAGQGRFAEAETAARKALAIDPACPGGRATLGQLLEAQNRPLEAMAEYNKALEADPEDARLHFGIGRVLVNQERYEEGIRHLLKSLDTRDENSKPSYLYAVGAAYARAGKREHGLRYLRLARELAAARGQSRLAGSVEEDLRLLEAEGGPR